MDVNDASADEMNVVIELPEGRTDEMNIQDRQIVNGDSYASRAARTASYEYPPRQERVRYSENVMPQRPKTAFFTPSKTTSARSVFEALEQA